MRKPSPPAAADTSPVSPRLGGLGALHAAAALFGLAGLFGKWLALPPVTLVAGRAAFAAVTLALVARWLKLGRSSPDAALALTGFVLALHWLAFFEAIRVSTVAVGLLGFASFPLFVLALGLGMERRRPGGVEIATALLVTAGLAVVVPAAGVAGPVLLGLAWGLLSGASFAVLAVANRRLAHRRHPVDIARWQNSVAALALLPWLLAAGAWPGVTGLLGLALLGVVCTALAHTLFIAGMRTRSAQTASVVVALEPVYGALFALVLLGEVPAWRTLAGGAMIVSACVLQARRAPSP